MNSVRSVSVLLYLHAVLTGGCSLWRYADTSYDFDSTDIISATQGLTVDECCQNCSATPGCSFFTSTATAECVLGVRKSGTAQATGSTSGGIEGAPLPGHWNPTGSCGRWPSCSSSMGCENVGHAGRGGSCERSAPLRYVVGREERSCTYLAANLTINQWVSNRSRMQSACSQSQCDPGILGAPPTGCECNMNGTTHCCIKDMEWCSIDLNTGVYPPNHCSEAPRDPSAGVQHPRCWTRDATTGQLFCTGFDSTVYKDDGAGHLSKEVAPAECDAFSKGNVTFKDSWVEPPPAPETPPANGLCSGTFCDCCAAGDRQTYFEQDSVSGDCRWSCSAAGANSASLAKISWCSKPNVAELSRCGANAYPTQFDPCEQLCASKAAFI